MKISTSRLTVDFYGGVPSDIQERLKKYPFVELHESVDFEYMPNILASATMLLYLSNKKGSSQIPGKLFDYMGTSKPVLCLVSDTTDPISLLLKRFERCIVLDNDETVILNSWNRIEEACGKSFMPEEKFSPKFVASQIIKLL